MSYKFKKGQLVEVTGSDSGRKDVIGVRFLLGEYGLVYSITIDDQVYAWATPICDFSARECYLKLVNPDSEESSEFAFEELMLDLKQGVLVDVE